MGDYIRPRPVAAGLVVQDLLVEGNTSVTRPFQHSCAARVELPAATTDRMKNTAVSPKKRPSINLHAAVNMARSESSHSASFRLGPLPGPFVHPGPGVAGQTRIKC